MSSFTGTRLSADHTFKVSANIGFHVSGKWVKLFDSLFIVMNQLGLIVAWQLCKGAKCSKVKDLLEKLYERTVDKGLTVESFSVDNCCSWGKKLKSVFGNSLRVTLDPFHAIQRVVKAIPKRSNDESFSLLRKRMTTSLRLIIRAPGDLDDIRMLPTSSLH